MTDLMCRDKTQIEAFVGVPEDHHSLSLMILVEHRYTYLSDHGSSASNRITPEGGKYAYASVPPAPSNLPSGS